MTADELRALMARQGWRQGDVAAALHVSYRQVDRWLAGANIDYRTELALLHLTECRRRRNKRH